MNNMNKRGLSAKTVLGLVLGLMILSGLWQVAWGGIKGFSETTGGFTCNLKSGVVAGKTMSCLQYKAEHDCPGDHSRYPRNDDVIAGVKLDKENVKDITPVVQEWKIEEDNPFGITEVPTTALTTVRNINRETIANHCQDKYYCYKNLPEGHECYPINPSKEDICGIKYISGGSIEAQVRYNVQRDREEQFSNPKGMPLEWMTTDQECIVSREDCAEAAKKLCDG